MMNNVADRVKRILDEYFAGSLSGALEERIRRWIADPRNRAEKDRALENIWNERVGYEAIPGEFAQGSVDALFSRIGFPEGTRGNEEEKREEDVPEVRGGKRLVIGWKKVVFRVAAVVIPLLVVGGVMLWSLGRQEVAWITQVADAGVQERIILPDGSELWLNPNSEVSYPEKFENRQVKLVGDALFDVVKNDKAPFTVSTRELNVTVHGTRFQVAAYGNKDRSTVTLHSGSVAVEVGEAETILEPGNQLQYYHDEGAVRVESVELGEWGKPSLDFYDATLEEIFFSLEANYEVELRVDGPLPEQPHYTVRFSREQSIDEVIQILERLTRSFTSTAGEDNKIDITLVPHT